MYYYYYCIITRVKRSISWAMCRYTGEAFHFVSYVQVHGRSVPFRELYVQVHGRSVPFRELCAHQRQTFRAGRFEEVPHWPRAHSPGRELDRETQEC